MTYVKAYLSALFYISAFIGVLYLMFTVTFENNLIASYLTYLALIASLAGPIGVYIKERK